VSAPPILFHLPAWGAFYVDSLLEFGLPSQLAPGNLGDFPWRAQAEYLIHTTQSDRARIEAHPAFRRLSELMPVRFENVEPHLGRSKFGALTETQRTAVRAADARGAVLFFLQPDMVWSAGALQNAARRLVEGSADAVMAPGPRTTRETMLPALAARRGADGVLELAPRELVGLAMAHMHHQARAWVWNDSDFEFIGPYLMWPAGQAGLVLHGWVLHPVALRARVRGAPFHHIFDQDYLAAACPDPARCHVVASSDEGLFFELSPGDWFRDFPRMAAREIDVAAFAEFNTNPHHRDFVRRSIRLIAAEGAESDWLAAEAAGRKVVARILGLLAQPDSQLLAFARPRLGLRLRGRYRLADPNLNGSIFHTADDRLHADLIDVMPLLTQHADRTDARIVRLLALEQNSPSEMAADGAARIKEYAALLRRLLARERGPRARRIKS